MQLYKYFHPNENTLSCFKDKYLYGATPEQLNDPFELWFVHKIQDSTPEQIKSYLKHQGVANNKSVSEMKRLYNKMGKQGMLNEIKRNVEAMNRNARMVCLSQNENSLLMWAHYTDQHKGVLAKLNLSKIDGIYEMQYSKKTPRFNPIRRDLKSNFQDVFLTKHTDWEYEKEFRMVVINGPRFYLPENAIQEIVFGVRCEDSYIKSVKEIFPDKKIKFRYAKKVPGEYRLEYKNDK